MEWVLFAIALGVLSAWGYYKNATRRLKKQLREAPRRAIGSLDEGEPGRIIGEARVHEQRLLAPLSGRECVYYIAKVQEDDGDGGWRERLEEEDSTLFVIDDGSGRAIVDPHGAELAITFDYVRTTGTFTPPDDLQQRFLERWHYRDRGLIFRKQLRFREAIIEVGEKVAVLGAGLRELDPTRPPAGYRDSQPTLLRIARTGDRLVIISDDPSTTQ